MKVSSTEYQQLQTAFDTLSKHNMQLQSAFAVQTQQNTQLLEQNKQLL